MPTYFIQAHISDPLYPNPQLHCLYTLCLQVEYSLPSLRGIYHFSGWPICLQDSGTTSGVITSYTRNLLVRKRKPIDNDPFPSPNIKYCVHAVRKVYGKWMQGPPAPICQLRHIRQRHPLLTNKPKRRKIRHLEEQLQLD